MPDTWVAILLFILVGLPGIYREALREDREVRPKESTLRELGRAVITSLYAVAPGILGAVSGWLAVTREAVDIAAILEWDTDYVSAYFFPLFSACIGYLVLAMLCVRAYESWQRGCMQGVKPTAGSVWVEVFENDPEAQGREVYAQVWIKDGTQWFGRIKHYTTRVENDRPFELVLSQPVLYKSATASSPRKINHVARVILTSEDISAISVTYNSPV